MGQWVRLPLLPMNREIRSTIRQALDIAGDIDRPTSKAELYSGDWESP